MKRQVAIILIAVTLLSLAGVMCGAAPQWLHVFRRTGAEEAQVERVATYGLDTIGAVYTQYTPYGDSLRIENGELQRVAAFSLDSVTRVERADRIPRIIITTDSVVDEIPSKEYYLDATITIEGNGQFESLKPTRVSIKGRGNSTWSFPKKPYRLKFDKKISLLGLAKAKSYALIANYIDGTLMRNVFAYKAAGLLGVDYSNHCVPVDVVLNGKVRGSYFLTEKLGINSGSVDIDDEKGALIEFDTEMDENYCYRTSRYNLPLMVKDPDLDDWAEKDTTFLTQAWMDTLKADIAMLELAASGTDSDVRLEDYVHLEDLADYVLIQLVCGNQECNHPKSTYMWRESRDDKWHFGPVWDVDWAFEYPQMWGETLTRTFCERDMPGGIFFYDMLRQEAFLRVFAERWDYYRSEVWPLMLPYMDEYAKTIEVSALQNGELWPMGHADQHPYYKQSSETFRSNYGALRDWIEDRFEFLETAPHFGLF